MSAYPPLLQQDICYVEVGVLKNWKQLFLSVTYSLFIVAGVRHLFILILHLYNHEVPAKHPREKILDPRNATRKNFGPRNTHEIKFGPTKYPREKISDSQNTHDKKSWIHEIPSRKTFRFTKYPRKKMLDP